MHKTTEPQYTLEQELHDSVHLLLLHSMKCKLLNWLTIFHFKATTLSSLLALTQQKTHFSTKKKPILYISTHKMPSLMEPGWRMLVKKTQTAWREREIYAKSTVLRPPLDCYVQIQAHTHQHHWEQNREWVFSIRWYTWREDNTSHPKPTAIEPAHTKRE